jgi:hypothetical protein
MRNWIEQYIREDVRADIHGDLYGVDRAANAIINFISTELITALREEAYQSEGAYGDGLCEAIDLIQRRLQG